MFGYVRPEKSMLLMRDFARYRSIYCGLCKTVSARGGQIPRLAVTYDMTFLALLLLSFSKDDSETCSEACILNPLKKKPIAKAHPALDFAADMTCLLAYLAAQDERRDEHPVRGAFKGLALRRAGRKAASRYPETARKLEGELETLHEIERGTPDLKAAADSFGRFLRTVMETALDTAELTEPALLDAALPEVGTALGRWIYAVDAFDDLPDDRHNKQWNPFSDDTDALAFERADLFLREQEMTLDRLLALLPYVRDGAIVGNIVTLGLPATRERVMNRVPLPNV